MIEAEGFSQSSFEGAVEDGGQQSIQFDGGLGFQERAGGLGGGGLGNGFWHLFMTRLRIAQAKLRRNAMASARFGKVASIFAPVLNRT